MSKDTVLVSTDQDIKKNSPHLLTSTDKLVYVKNGTMYLLTSLTKKQLVGNINDATYRVSKNGELIGWINRKPYKFDVQNNVTEHIGYSIAVLDLKTNAVKEVAKVEIPNDSTGQIDQLELRRNSIEDFDFSNDLTQIAYIRDGVRILNLSDNKDTKILDNYEGEIDNVTDNQTYSGLEWNSSKRLLLLRKSVWECGFTELYDLESKKVQKLTLDSCAGAYWSNDGNHLISYASTGIGGAGGVWVTDLKTLKTESVIDVDKVGLVTIYGIDELSDNQYLALIRPAYPEEDIKVITEENFLYLAYSDGKIQPLPKFKSSKVDYISHLEVLPNKSKFSYLINVGDRLNPRFDLKISDIDGGNVFTLLEDIQSYELLP